MKHYFKIFFVFVFIGSSFSCIMQRNEKKELSNISGKMLSKEIYKKQLRITPKKNIPSRLKENRDSLKWLSDTDQFTQTDTLFLVENYRSNPEDGLYSMCATLYSKNKVVSYIQRARTKSLITLEEDMFSRYMLKLIRDWDIKQLKHEGKYNSAISIFSYNFATRITFNDNIPKIDIIGFTDFVNFKKDLEFE